MGFWMLGSGCWILGVGYWDGTVRFPAFALQDYGVAGRQRERIKSAMRLQEGCKGIAGARLSRNRVESRGLRQDYKA